ncbi:Uncharacterised protein [Ralstonia mannitolilytica]|uniref:Uncharacterized protein n=1 Tax=Ralstonia mannitolilytica TaxID=105219 RepID=A0AAJ4ZN41_9RALS|nr:hypothetical protein LMG6866_03767 [Ralstonia mannitolilytica]CAJ0731746.1 hypothetical protein R77592_02770 [Ralstonia mannitolilytica]SUD89127.1 Uncharacterised protein [Ralstonia mannitolilytica]SUD98616.1 Uncharacterised protein [Ralstonia mannitolilytica]
MANHVYEAHERCSNPGVCPICDGGLSVCTVCGGIEGSLTTECPGVRMSADEQDRVYAGLLDFQGGEWVRVGEGGL